MIVKQVSKTMTDSHPITPPPELVEAWIREANHNEPMFAQVAVMGAQWGADQELEACAKEVSYWSSRNLAKRLRDCRRPKPLSLKEQALALVNGCNDPHGDCLDDAALDTIRRALEALPE